MTIKASRKNRTVYPFPRHRVLVPFERKFSPEEFERVKLGVFPDDMGHWLIFLEGRRRQFLYFVRSWSGYTVYKLLVEKSQDEYRVAEAWVSRDARLAAGETVLVSRRVRPPLQINISPIRNSIIETARPISAVAFVHDPLRRQRPAQEVLRALYGLTPAECRVALLLADGLAPRKIADMVGVTDNTVRSQIKSIYAKTGVKRQAELIRLLLNNLAFEISAAPRQ